MNGIADLTRVALGTSEVAPAPRDARFADPAWTEHPVYRRLMQAYLVWTGGVDELVDGLDGDWRDRMRMRYLASLLTGALAPTNVLAGNPAALRRAFDTGGASLLRGAGNLLRDLHVNGGLPAQVDRRGFRVGENLAATPGAVVHREEICEVVQYAPAGATVRARPLMIVPPQINRHYFLDLAPGRSLVEYLVAQGIQYFTIVWRNPGPQHGAWGIDDYVAAQERALDVVREVTGSDDVNVLGACAGGLTTALMLGRLAAERDERVNAATFAICMVDAARPNLLMALLGGAQAPEQGGVHDRLELARLFAWMRPSDLVFNSAVANWLLGEDPPAFDVLAWNADGANLTARLGRELLDVYRHNRAAQPGGLEVLGTPIDLGRVTVDNFVVAGRTDHITPWEPCYMTSQALGGRSEVVVTSTGHLQTIVNPPGKPRAAYFAGPEPGPDPDAWIAQATRHEGSWWPRYAQWLTERSGDELPAPARLGSRAHPAGDPAPGLYVHG